MYKREKKSCFAREAPCLYSSPTSFFFYMPEREGWSIYSRVVFAGANKKNYLSLSLSCRVKTARDMRENIYNVRT